MDKIPYSMEAEQSVLGSLMIDNSIWHEVCEIVGVEQFYVANHREIFKAMHSLAIAGKPLDPITLHERLQSLDLMIEFGYLHELIDATVSTVNALNYAEIVRETAIRRESIKASNKIIELMQKPNGQSIIEITSKAQSIIDEATKGSDRSQDRPATMNDAIRETVLHMEEVKLAKGLPGLSTGLIDCDKRTMGMMKGDLHVLGAAPSMGKTARMLGIIKANLDKPTLVFSLEMPKNQLIQRLLADIADVNYGKIRAVKPLDQEEWDRLTAQMAILREKPLHIDDKGGLKPEQIYARARRFKRENPDLGLIAVDYLQLIKLASSDVNFETAEIITGLKALAKELDCSILALSQLNRANAARKDKRPHMSDLRNSGEIEAAADTICMIYRDEVYNPDDPDNKGCAELIWRKVRAGEIGTDFVGFDGSKQRFFNLTSIEQDYDY